MREVLLFRVANGTGHYYTEHPSEVVFDLHEMVRGAAGPCELTITPIYVSQMEADTLTGEYYYEDSEGPGRERVASWETSE